MEIAKLVHKIGESSKPFWEEDDVAIVDDLCKTFPQFVGELR